ncbi:MAG: hypothetical protein K2Q25_12920 [Mycobacteriaceae bacterium]|nr:hypothetical protein [Mycobacteriaceae bacterium]
MSRPSSSDSYELPAELKKRLQQVLKQKNAECGTEKYTYDGKLTVTVAGDVDAEKMVSPYKSYALIFLAMLFTAGIITFFTAAGSPARNNSTRKSVSPHDDTDEERVFAASGQHLLDAHRMLSDVNPQEGWAGGSKSYYATRNAEFTDMIKQIAATSQGVDSTVQTEAEQVDNGREILGNSLVGLQLAIPVSEVLYFSGPAGPALSYSFQLGVANSAVGTSVDTTNAMHKNSVQHAERLTTLTQRYDAVRQSVTAAGYPAEHVSKSGSPTMANQGERDHTPQCALSSFANRPHPGNLVTAAQQVVPHPKVANQIIAPPPGSTVRLDDEPAGFVSNQPGITRK